MAEPTRICESDLCRRSISAGSAACVSVLCLTPFDVIKTRLQAQSVYLSQGVSYQGAFVQKLAVAGCPNMCDVATLSANRWATYCPPDCSVYLSTRDAVRKIYRQEGLRVFWRGTKETLLMAVPMVGLYLPLYDMLVERLASLGIVAPMVAGALARTASVFCVSPIEVLRVRLQIIRETSPSRSHLTQLSAFDWGQGGGILRKARALWAGFGATVLRDVPFTMVYWGLMEQIRKSLLLKSDHQALHEVLYANSVAGASAGVVASVITNPMDVAKTRLQITQKSSTPTPTPPSTSVLSVLRDIYRKEGMKGLFSGVGPRTLRIGPSCAIVLSTYEVLKRVL